MASQAISSSRMASSARPTRESSMRRTTKTVKMTNTMTIVITSYSIHYTKLYDVKIEEGIRETRALAQETDDHDLREMAKEELRELELALPASEERLKFLLIPPDPMEEKNIIMEIRGGTGGEEAALFAADLYRMYVRYAETKGWKYEVLSSNETGLGGYKEITFSISGKYVYGSLRYESGVHRVQRVPATEASGRIHTSAVTVAVLPEAEETEITIRQEDLRIDVMRAGGPGGQSYNFV